MIVHRNWAAASAYAPQLAWLGSSPSYWVLALVALWRWGRYAMLALALLLAAACGGGGGDDEPEPAAQSTAPSVSQVNPSSVIGSSREQEISISGSNLSGQANITLSWRGVANYRLPSAQISFDSSTLLRIRVTTMEDADDWTVTITNPDGQSTQTQFRVVDPRLIPLEVTAPVEGAYRVTAADNIACNNATGLWTLCQHGTEFHSDTGGISGSNDALAWDINLPGDLDAGRPVFAVAAGRVVRYANTVAPGAVSGAVLIEHRSGELTWWSGYLHLSDVEVVEGQEVTPLTRIGRISNVCECGVVPNHLHFVIYYGHNSAGQLKSRQATFRERTSVSASGQIVVGDSSGVLRIVDPVSQQTRTIGAMGVVMTDIALSPSGVLYGVTSNDLYRIDLQTAQITYIGSHRASLVALAFRRDGTLMGAGGDRLVTVDVATARATEVGRMSRLALGDLEFTAAGDLYMTATSGELVRLDPSTAATTIIGPIGYSRLYGLSAAVLDSFYSFSGARLLRIDARTGVAEVLFDAGTFEVWGATTIQ